MKKTLLTITGLTLGLVIFSMLVPLLASAAQPFALPNVNLTLNGGTTEPEKVQSLIQLVILLTILSLAPAILLLVTSFTRIIIVLSLIRTALGTQQMPPNQVIVGLSLFLTFFIMSPVINRVNTEALKPYYADQISGEVAMTRAVVPVKEFMLKQVREKDLALFIKIAKEPRPSKPEDVTLTTLIPAFVISELKTAFQIGFMIYLPFLILDMVVASVLLSMGMMMLPPIMVSLPFKLLLFVLVDGWHLIVGSLVQSFH
ncbi:MAG: flagellar biosynthetic protein FliP [Deltaproteobacteria bacterium HGW-Deltaproteobacteria-7]|jgi:flagellar biosynthetic protein FliP|nr:MAG: flagellar biosynthetic protein FliP [Deltaproteobacteria bacterium HGW-Deltaproteobacteria-7]PKN20785.1 MAG: flagellar biosynthetic protein FliP [Deltaproteobacteria bacterium HGW-Deltaproteobacteria-6]